MNTPVIASILMLVIASVVLLFGPLIVANVYNAMVPALTDAGSTDLNNSVARTLSNFYSAINITGVALILIGVGALFWALRGGLGSAF